MFFITTIRWDSPESVTSLFGDKGWNGVSDSRCFGYYLTKKDAIEAVVENRGDLHECLYNYIVIELLPQGIHPIPEEELWFKWIIDYSNDTNESIDGFWIETNKPEWSNHIVNWAFG